MGWIPSLIFLVCHSLVNEETGEVVMRSDSGRPVMVRRFRTAIQQKLP